MTKINKVQRGADITVASLYLGTLYWPFQNNITTFALQNEHYIAIITNLMIIGGIVYAFVEWGKYKRLNHR
ncbi:MAG: hypothetical protein WCW27_03965 [Patescibacteria group bacterium]|jgi:hypothetical protein